MRNAFPSVYALQTNCDKLSEFCNASRAIVRTFCPMVMAPCAKADLSPRARLGAPAQSVADVCLLQGHPTRSTRLHGLRHQTSCFRRGLGSMHRFHLLLVVQVGSRLGLVHHVRLGQRPTPTGELQRDAVWVLKVDGPYKGVLVGLSGQILSDTWSVRVIDDLGDGKALRPELVAIGLNLVARHIQRDVIHGADGRAPWGTWEPAARLRDPRSGWGRIVEPKERDGVTTIADIEEEMLSAAAFVCKLQGLHQLHAKNVRVKIHGALHVTASQCEVVNASELELCIGERCHIFVPSRVGPKPRLHVLKAMITRIVCKYPAVFLDYPSYGPPNSSSPLLAACHPA